METLFKSKAVVSKVQRNAETGFFGRSSRVHVSSASKGRDRRGSVWDVAQGYILYWHMVLILSVLIPAGTLCLDYAVDVVGMSVGGRTKSAAFAIC